MITAEVPNSQPHLWYLCVLVRQLPHSVIVTRKEDSYRILRSDQNCMGF